MCLIETMQQQKQLQTDGDNIYKTSCRLLYFQCCLIEDMRFFYPDRLEKSQIQQLKLKKQFDCCRS